ncbi:MAG: mechanosensitive ion channel family protein [Bacteroidota bacterium]
MKEFFNSPRFYYLVVAVVIYAAAYITSLLLRKTMQRFFIRSSQSLNVDPTKYSFLKNAVSFLVFLTATILVFVFIPGLKRFGLTLTAGAGVLTAIIAFASQAAFSNIISGIFIVIFRPFRVNDIIKIGDLYMGVVEDITLRHTVIRNFENRRIIVPNSVISSETIINSNIEDPRICNFVEIGISYDSDLDKAMEILREVSEAHPNCIDNRTDEDKEAGNPVVTVRILGFEESAMRLRAWVWSEDSGKGFVMRTDLYRTIKMRFDKEGIEIPYPHRTLVMKHEKPANEPLGYK